MTVLTQRPLKGSRISTFYPVKSLPPLSSLDSAFQLQEYISLLIRLDIHDVDAIVSIPDKAGKDGGGSESSDAPADTEGGGKSEFAVDEACWIYEQLRRLAQDLSHPLITMLQQECTRVSCPEMKAGEWLYLCVAHGDDGALEQCCAIDYILHTVDSATALLNSPRTFPSRLSIPQSSRLHFQSLARRLGRIFAHAYFHHRETFEQAEAESSLHARFLALTSKFDLVFPEFLAIPSRSQDDPPNDVEPPRLLAASIEPRLGNTAGVGSEQEGEPIQEDRGRDISGLARSYDPQSMLEHSQSTGTDIPRNPSPWKGRSRTDTMVHSEAFSVAEELARSNDETSFTETPASLETPAYSDVLAPEAEDGSDEANASVVEAPLELDPDLVDGVPVSSSGEPTAMDIPHIPSAQTTEHDLTDTLIQAPNVPLEEVGKEAEIDLALAEEPQAADEESASPADIEVDISGPTHAEEWNDGIVEEERVESTPETAPAAEAISAQEEAVPAHEETESLTSAPENAEEAKDEDEALLAVEEEGAKVEEKDVSEAIAVDEGEEAREVDGETKDESAP